VIDPKHEIKKLRFGVFELDTASGELWRDGKAQPRLRDQALQILQMLLEHPRELVTREELRDRLWSSDTFVDFDHGLNTAVNQLRSAFGDSAANPRFIQTLPRRGYRFLVPVETTPAVKPKAIKRLIVLPFRMLRPAGRSPRRRRGRLVRPRAPRRTWGTARE